MKSALMISLLVLIGTGMLSCDGPKVVFPEEKEVAIISGVIDPPRSKAMVYLRDAALIDSVRCDSVTGGYQFRNIPFGVYTLEVKAKGFGAVHKLITVDYKIKSCGTVILSRYPSQIQQVTPEDSSTVPRFSKIITSSDTVVNIEIRFSERMDTASVAAALSTTPELPGMKLDWQISSITSGGYLIVRVPAIHFYAVPKVQLTLKKSAKTVYGSGLDFDFNLVYFPDTSLLPLVVSKTFFTIEPFDGRSEVDVQSNLTITFNYEMLQSSVEKNLSISPSASPNFFWSRSSTGNRIMLTVRFAEPLMYNTRYTVLFDTGMMTQDSICLPVPVRTVFTTKSMRLTNYYPLNGDSTVQVRAPFVYESQFAIDSASFRKAFSIKPGVDSIKVSMEKSGSLNRVVVYHAALKPSSAYTITIDTTLRSVDGGRIGSLLEQHFFTADSLKPDTAKNLVQSWFPNDSINPITTVQSVWIYFNQQTDPFSVESRLHISPSVPFKAEWDGTTSLLLTVRPLQPFRSATTYTVTLDSGYTSSDGLYGKPLAFSFTTEPLMLSSYTPCDGQINVSRSDPFRFNFNTPVDPVSLKSSISFKPATDSLVITALDSSLTHHRQFLVHRSSLIADTSYTVTLQGSLCDIYGVSMGTDFTIRFKTGK